MTQADNMESRKTNGFIKVILICAALALAFGTGIYVTSLLDSKADPVQNKTETEKKNAVIDEDSATDAAASDSGDAPVSDQSSDDFELPVVDVDSPAEQPGEYTVSSDDQEVDISGYEPAETPEPVSSDTVHEGSTSETWEEDDELPEVPVYTAP